MPIPPLSAIRVFEAAARNLSFTRAAEELGMTQAGVSYQIKLLEGRLGAALFLRKPKGLALTDLGIRLAGPTGEAFAQLRDIWTPETEGVQGRLNISTLPAFGGNWLAQRLGRFQIAHPDLAVRLDSSDRLVDFAREDFDVVIRYGNGDWPGLTAHHLMAVEYTPMMSPGFLRDNRITRPADLLRVPLLDVDDPNWTLWLREAGLQDGPPDQPRRSLGTQIFEARAAMAGQGVALLTPRFFRFELATGALVQPFEQVTTGTRAYYLAYPTARRNRPAIRAFRCFLMEEVAQCGMGGRAEPARPVPEN